MFLSLLFQHTLSWRSPSPTYVPAVSRKFQLLPRRARKPKQGTIHATVPLSNGKGLRVHSPTRPYTHAAHSKRRHLAASNQEHDGGSDSQVIVGVYIQLATLGLHAPFCLYPFAKHISCARGWQTALIWPGIQDRHLLHHGSTTSTLTIWQLFFLLQAA